MATNAQLRRLRIARQRIRFFTKQAVEKTPVIEVKTPTGKIRVSAPEATVVDLVRFNKSAGGLGNAATVIGDMAPSLKPELLLKAVEVGHELPVIQRVGYILDLVDAGKHAAPPADWIVAGHSRTTPPVPGRPVSQSPRNARWNIIENDRIEVEA